MRLIFSICLLVIGLAVGSEAMRQKTYDFSFYLSIVLILCSIFLFWKICIISNKCENNDLVDHDKTDTKITKSTIVCLIFALIGGIFIAISFYVDKEKFWYLFIPGLVPYLVFIWGFSTKCPQCERWWASSHQGSELLDRWQETKDVVREDVTRDRSGKEISKTKRIEQVIVSCEKKRHHYNCKHCDAVWTSIKTHRT